MKKFVLLVCLLPGLAFAQSVSNKAAKFQRLFQRSASVETRASVFASATLDSIYWYQGSDEKLTTKKYFTYNEAGQTQTELTKTISYSDGGFVISYKTEYSYAGTAEDKSEEEISYHLENGQWIPGYKTVTKYNHTQTPIAVYQYYYEEGVWVNDNFQVSAEFNAEGYPTVLMDSTFQKEEPVVVMRMEATYDNKHNVAGLNILKPGKTNGEWIPDQKAKLSYDEAGRILSQYHEEMEEGKWKFSFLYTYEYDERGNMIREIDKNAEFEKPYSIRYQNFYSDNVVTKNESIHVNNSIRIAMSAGGSKALSVDLGEEQRATVTIISVAGAVVRRISLHDSLSTISLNELNGYYIVHIQTSGGVKSQSVIIR